MADVVVNNANFSIDIFYPIGSIYMSVNNTSPNLLFGGEGDPIKDKFLLASGDLYAPGTGGGRPLTL